MSNKIPPKNLSHDLLRQILKDHAQYNEAKGRSGMQADLSGYIIEDFDFSGLNLSSINARSSTFIRCQFVGCDLSGIYFNGSTLIGANVQDTTLWKAEFIGTNASKACFDNADAGDVNFDEADLHGATFRNANLRGASFSDCNLTNAIFDGADLEYASVTNNVEDGTSWVNVKGRVAA